MTHGELRILLVEDNPGDAVLLEETLSAADQRSSIAHVERLAEAARVPGPGRRQRHPLGPGAAGQRRAVHAGAGHRGGPARADHGHDRAGGRVGGHRGGPQRGPGLSGQRADAAPLAPADDPLGRRAEAARDGAGGRQGRRRSGQPGQEPVPGQHEPRASHPDERHRRHDRPGPPRTARPRCPRVPPDGQGFGRRADGTPQSTPGPVADRGRRLGVRVDGVPASPPAGQDAQAAVPPRPPKGAQADPRRAPRRSPTASSAIPCDCARSSSISWPTPSSSPTRAR